MRRGKGRKEGQELGVRWEGNWQGSEKRKAKAKKGSKNEIWKKKKWNRSSEGTDSEERRRER